MADTLLDTPESIDSHPDFPEFFRQAQDELWTTFGPRVEQATAGGNQGAVERLMAELDRQARSRAVVATRAMLNFQSGQGGPGLSRAFTSPQAVETLAGAQGQSAPPSAPPMVGTPPTSLTGAPVNRSALAPLDTTGPTTLGEVSYPENLPSLGQRVQSVGASMAMPFGLGASGAVEEVGPAQTLSGEQTPVFYQGIDMGAVAAQDPAGAAIGQMLGFGPALNAAGAIGRAVGSSPPVQALGRTLARPAVGVPLALGGSLMASTGEAQAPTAPDPATLAATTRADIATLTAQQKTLNDEIAALGTLPDPSDPQGQRRITFQQRFGNVGPGSTPAEIRALQEFLASPAGYGLYRVNQAGRPVVPDGRWFAADGRTSGTQLAVAAYLERIEQERARRERRLTEIGGQLSPLQQRLSRLDANAASAASEANMTPLQRFVRDWVPPLSGIAGSLIGGAGGRWFFRRGGDRASQVAANQADDLLARTAGGDAMASVGGMNQFFARGGGRPPFAITPNTPAGFTPIPGQSAMDLYNPGSSWMRSNDWARVGGALGIGALGAGRYFGVDRPSLEEAQRRYDANPTQDNANALRRAEYFAAAAQSSMAFGLGAALGYPGTAGVMRYRSPRPDLGRAEAEVMRLNALAQPRPTPITEAEVLRRRNDRGFSLQPGTPRLPGETERWVSPRGDNMIYRDPETGHWMRQGPRLNRGRPHRFPSGPPRSYRMISSVDGGDGGDTAVG